MPLIKQPLEQKNTCVLYCLTNLFNDKELVTQYNHSQFTFAGGLIRTVEANNILSLYQQDKETDFRFCTIASSINKVQFDEFRSSLNKMKFVLNEFKDRTQTNNTYCSIFPCGILNSDKQPHMVLLMLSNNSPENTISIIDPSKENILHLPYETFYNSFPVLELCAIVELGKSVCIFDKETFNYLF